MPVSHLSQGSNYFLHKRAVSFSKDNTILKIFVIQSDKKLDKVLNGLIFVCVRACVCVCVLTLSVSSPYR